MGELIGGIGGGLSSIWGGLKSAGRSIYNMFTPTTQAATTTATAAAAPGAGSFLSGITGVLEPVANLASTAYGIYSGIQGQKAQKSILSEQARSTKDLKSTVQQNRATPPPRTIINEADPYANKRAATEADRTKKAIRAMKGRGSTILTGAMGLKPLDEEKKGKVKLLGR